MSNDRLIEIDAGLSGGHVGPVIAVSELPRARRFYEGQLGLSGEAVPGGWMLRTQSGTVCYLLAEIPDAGSASWPVASFSVQDLRATVGSCESATCRSLRRAT